MNIEWLLALFIINLIAALIVCFAFLRRDKQKAIAYLLIFIAIPILGLVLFGLVAWIFSFKKKKENEYDLSDLMTFQSAKKYFFRPNMDEELNFVSVEESIQVSNTQEKRILVRNILKKDIDQYSKSVLSALKDNDSETTHYAASAIMEVFRKMTLGLDQIETEFKESPDDMEIAQVFASALAGYIESGILSKRDREQSVQKYLAVVDRIYAQQPELLTDQDYIRQSDFYAETGDLASAEIWAKSAMEFHKQEDTYMNMLKICYLAQDKSKFDSVLTDLRHSPVVLSEQSLDRLRFWIER